MVFIQSYFMETVYNITRTKNKTLKNNLMNSDVSTSKVPSNTGTDLTSSQLKSVDETIRNQQ